MITEAFLTPTIISQTDLRPIDDKFYAVVCMVHVDNQAEPRKIVACSPAWLADQDVNTFSKLQDGLKLPSGILLGVNLVLSPVWDRAKIRVGIEAILGLVV